MQIHGPVSFLENIDCIVVNHRHRGDRKVEKLLNEFIEKNNCNLIWMTKDGVEHNEYEEYSYEDDYDDYGDYDAHYGFHAPF